MERINQERKPMKEVLASDLIDMIQAKIDEFGDCPITIEQDPNGVVPPNEVAVFDDEGEPILEMGPLKRPTEFFIQ